MKKATINIEIVRKNYCTDSDMRLEGTAYLLMKGLTDAIKELEESMPEEQRADFRTEILTMLNRRCGDEGSNN